MTRTSSLPTDPGFSANLYANGMLDRLIVEAIAPFRDALVDRDADARLWAIRYSRRGEHLKLRVHAAIPAADIEALLRRHADRFFETAPARPDEQRTARFDIPAIDPQDEGDELEADRTVLPTTYQRSEVTLGDSLLFAYDAVIDGMYSALAHGFARGLTIADSEDFATQRLNLLIASIIDGLDATSPGQPEERARYLEYHRDWLLRFFVTERAGEADLRRHFVDRARVLLRSFALPDTEAPSEDQTTDPWIESMRHLAASLEHLPDDLDLDPFAATPSDPVLFKTLHGVANSFGVHPMNEAFAYHLLACAVAPAAIEVEA
ncbi:MAG: lantibiotic dehydratase C-terminal domain-containing protein [Acidobacteriota bacterium]